MDRHFIGGANSQQDAICRADAYIINMAIPSEGKKDLFLQICAEEFNFNDIDHTAITKESMTVAQTQGKIHHSL